MILTSEITIDIYSIMILVVIYINATNHTEKIFLQHKIYLSMIKVTMVMLVVDIFSRFDGSPNTIYTTINYVGNFMIFLLNPLIPSLWLLYSYCKIVNDEKKTKGLVYYLSIIYVIYVALLILSQFFGWFYYIDVDNIYHRGSLFWIPAYLTLALVLVTFILILANRKNIEEKYFFSLIFFPVPPFLCTILQIVYYGSSLALNGVTLSLLIVFLNIQSRNLHTDYLTGVYNRKKLEMYMKEKISASTENLTFSAILIDLNNFKAINDTYGHNIGDDALENCVNLVKTCLRSSDFIARFGGDEFYIILDVSTYRDLEVTIDRINKCINNYNEKGIKPYKISFSMGYAVYDYHSNMNVEEFQKYIDNLMYQDKRINRTKYKCVEYSKIEKKFINDI